MTLKNIKLIIIEFDGCISDGLIHLDKKGNQLKNFNIQDVDIINETSLKGYKIGIISKYNLSFLKKYIKKWNLAFVQGKVDNKLEWINKYIKNKFIVMSQIAYFGCSVSSLNIIDIINNHNGLTGCPANSYSSIIEKSQIVSNKNGGFGAVSEFLDLLNFSNYNTYEKFVRQKEAIEIERQLEQSKQFDEYEKKRQIKYRLKKRVQYANENTSDDSDDSDSDSKSNHENYRQRYNSKNQLMSTCNMSSPSHPQLQAPPEMSRIVNRYTKHRYSDDDSQA